MSQDRVHPNPPLPKWDPSPEFIELLTSLAKDWAIYNRNKVRPAHPNDPEITVDLYFKSTGVEMTVILDARSREILRIEFDYFNLKEIQRRSIKL